MKRFLTGIVVALAWMPGLAAQTKPAPAETRKSPPLVIVPVPKENYREVDLEKALTPKALRARLVRLEIEDLTKLDQTPLVLDLFGDVTFTVTLKKAPPPSQESQGWVGGIQGDPDSFVNLLIRPGAVVRGDEIHKARQVFLFIATSDGKGYELGPHEAKSKWHIVREIDRTKFSDHKKARPKAEGPKRKTPLSAKAATTETSPETCPTAIQLMVLYTPLAKEMVGGESAIKGRIDLAVQGTNAAFARSQIGIRLTVVYKAEIEDEETGNLDDILARFQSDGDTFMDEVHALRSTHHADLVSLVVHKIDPCGSAYRMKAGMQVPAFASQAFSVVAQDCMVGNFTLAHELGHNLGACDSLPETDPLFPYAFGKTFEAEGKKWKTIMATTSGIRIPYFSNPAVSYKGVPTGDPTTADSSRTLNATKTLVAAFE